MKKTFCFILFFVLTACAHTRIAARDIPAEANRLASINRTPLLFNVECSVDEIVGHQYLLIALPFGRISLEDPAAHIRNALYQELALSGYNPVPTDSAGAELLIRCKQVTLSAYDFIFLRNIVAQIDLTVIRRGTSITSHTRTNAWKAFAFHQQLEFLFSNAGKKAAQSVIKLAL